MGTYSYDTFKKQAEEGGTGGFEPLPNGTYDMEIKEAKFGTSKAGDDQIVIIWRVDGGPLNNRQVWQYITFPAATNPKAAVINGINHRNLGTLGCLPLMEQGASLEQVAGFLIGRKAQVTTAQRSYGEDKVATDVKSIKAVEQAESPFVAGGTGLTNPFSFNK